jgi:hypothetical protein
LPCEAGEAPEGGLKRAWRLEPSLYLPNPLGRAERAQIELYASALVRARSVEILMGAAGRGPTLALILRSQLG